MIKNKKKKTLIKSVRYINCWLFVSSFITISRCCRRIAQWSVWKSRKNSSVAYIKNFFFTFLEFAKKKNENGYKIAVMRIVACSSFFRHVFTHNNLWNDLNLYFFICFLRSWSFIKCYRKFFRSSNFNFMLYVFSHAKNLNFFSYKHNFLIMLSSTSIVSYCSLRPFYQWNKNYDAQFICIRVWARRGSQKKLFLFKSSGR